MNVIRSFIRCTQDRVRILNSSDQPSRANSLDDGFTLIEVMVAMMIFMIIATGVAYTMLSSFTLTNDSHFRLTAVNLASQEIDQDRATASIVDLSTKSPWTEQVGGQTFTVTRTVSWVDNNGNDVSCGSGTATLQFKRINVQVTWPGMVGNPVSVDTLLAPSEVVDSAVLGSIFVHVTTAAGAPAQGVTVTVTPSTGTTPAATDSQGCSYLVDVQPGAYNVSVTEPGTIAPTQSTDPSKAITVAAGASSSASFSLDTEAVATLDYASNYPSLSPQLPTNMPDTFVSTIGDSATAANTPATVDLYPTTYSATDAGNFVPSTASTGVCQSPDAQSWPNGTNGSGQTISSPMPQPLALSPGGSGSIGVPMGVVTLKNSAGYSSNAYISATTTTPVPGSADPGCSVATTYVFGQLMNKAKGSTVMVALPFGTWQFKMDTNSTPKTTLGSAQLSVPAGAAGTSISSSGIVTLDPRVASS
jgi:prepilin-type N-terminal cleavage/methylation domain-containing protein